MFPFSSCLSNVCFFSPLIDGRIYILTTRTGVSCSRPLTRSVFESMSYFVPFGVDLLWVDGGVRVGSGYVHMVSLHDFGDLVVNSQDGLTFLVRLWQRGFELLVSRAQSLRHRKHSVDQNLRGRCTSPQIRGCSAI